MSTKIIADACANHLGSRQLIEHMIKAAAEIGIDFIKFQSFKAYNLNQNWPDYENAYKYYKSVELSEEDHVFIMQKCKEYGIEPMFTVFDTSMIPFLKSIGAENAKVASPNADSDLFISELGVFKNTIVSCGMINLQRAMYLKRGCRAKLLYCISKYPAKYADIDFDKMQLFDGFSDHTENIQVAKKAIDLGMEYIERHFKLPDNIYEFIGINPREVLKDYLVSSTPAEFKELVEYRNYVEKCRLYKTRWNNG
jgi:sialic acid synthase SpsE